MRHTVNRLARRAALGIAVAIAASPAVGVAQGTAAPAPRTILAIGAHAGDMELTAGAVLGLQQSRGVRVVFLHLTLGEGGTPKLSPEAYGAQKRREALEVGAALGAEVMFGPWADGQLPDDEAARRWVADAIRQVKPLYVITHWRESIHKDHSTTHRVVKDAVLLASLAGVKTANPPHRGVRLWYAENWEDADGFAPFIYVDVGASEERWRDAVAKYEFVRGGVSSFAYLEYYSALHVLRGAEARKPRAVAFDVDAMSKRRVLDALP